MIWQYYLKQARAWLGEHWPYCLVLGFGSALLLKGTAIGWSFSSRLMHSGPGQDWGILPQRALGVVLIAFACTKTLRRRP